MAKETLYGKIYGDLLAAIQNGQYPNGSQLPSEKELTKRYGVSRITSQKALGMLVEQGYVRRIPGRGTFVERDAIKSAPSSDAPATTGTRKDGHKLIGLVVKEIGNFYGTALLKAIEQACVRHGFTLVLKYSGTEEQERRCIDELLEIGAAGMIVVCMHGETYSERILRLALDRFPIVLLDRGLRGIPISFVGTDNVQAAKELVEYLFAQGHREIGCLTHLRPEIDVIMDREKGFCDALLHHGYIASEKDNFVRLDMWHDGHPQEHNNEKLLEYIQNHPEKTAYMAVEHHFAEMMQAACMQAGIDPMPQIVSFDCLRESIFENMYTHIEQNETEMGTQALELVAQAIAGNTRPQTILVPYRLVEHT